MQIHLDKKHAGDNEICIYLDILIKNENEEKPETECRWSRRRCLIVLIVVMDKSWMI